MKEIYDLILGQNYKIQLFIIFYYENIYNVDLTLSDEDYLNFKKKLKNYLILI